MDINTRREEAAAAFAAKGLPTVKRSRGVLQTCRGSMMRHLMRLGRRLPFRSIH